MRFNRSFGLQKCFYVKKRIFDMMNKTPRLGLTVLGIVLTFAGLNVMLLINKLKPWIGAIFFIMGILILIYAQKTEIFERVFVGKANSGKCAKAKETEECATLAGNEDRKGQKKFPKKVTVIEKVVDKVTLGGKAWFIFPIVGIALIAIDVMFNLKVYGEMQWGSFDYSVTLLAIVLIVYHFIPEDYTREKNFMITFLSLLCFIIILPIVLSFAFMERTLNSSVEWYTSELLAKPLAAFVTFFGVPTTAYGEMITFPDINGHMNSLVISLGCSGIYSTMIFVSAFFGYVLTEYQRVNFRVALLLFVGILTAYVANILRMAIIVFVGYYYGMKALLFVHAYAGEIIFICWIAVFWYFMFKYLKPSDEVEAGTGPKDNACSKDDEGNARANEATMDNTTKESLQAPQVVKERSKPKSEANKHSKTKIELGSADKA